MSDTGLTRENTLESSSLNDGVAAAPQAVPLYSWYVLTVMTVTFALAAMDRAIVPVMLEPMREEFTLNDTQLGFLAGLAFSLTYTIFGIPAGMLSDRINRRKFLAAMSAAWSFMTALGGLAQNYTQLVIARMCVGAAESGVPTAVSIIADYFPARRRPAAVGIILAGGSLAIGFNFALGGWVAFEWGWRRAFLIVGLPGLFCSALILLTVREPVRGAFESRAQVSVEPAPPLRETIRHILRTPAAVHIFMGFMISNATIATYYSWVTSLLVRIHGLNIRDAGLLIAVGVGLMGFIGGLFGAFMSDRLGNRSLKAVLMFIATAAALMAPFGIGMSLAPTLPLAMACMVVVSVAKSSYLGPSQGLLLSLVKVRMRGVTVTLLNVMGMLVGFSFGPLIAGGLSQLFGGGNAIRYALSIIFVLNLWVALHYWLGTRTLERDLESCAR